MKKTFVFVLFLLMVTILSAAEIAVLTEINRPGMIRVDKDQIFITEDASIFIYSLDGKFQKKFGQKGEGPMEFMVTPDSGGLQIEILPDAVMATSIGKVSFFKRDGEFIRVIKAPRGVAFYRPLGDRFAGLGFAMDNSVLMATMNIYDGKLEKVMEMYRQKNPYQQGQKMNPFLTPPMPYTWKDTIVVDTRTGPILVFNGKGEKTAVIDHPFKPIELTAQHKEQVMDFYRTNPAIKDNFERIKNMIECPGTFPNIQQTTVVDGKIYAQTYRRDQGKAEFFIFDFSGKLLKHIFLPLADMNLLQPAPYHICNDVLYQVKEDLEKEQWTLCSTKIE